jgi:hypothetical protein
MTPVCRRLSSLPVAASCALALAGAARAQEPAPAASPAPAKVEVSGFVDVYYGYNFNKVDPLLRSFDVQHNTFSLSLAEVAFSRGVSPDSRVGFRADLDFGKTADIVASFEPEPDGKEIYKNIQQAYVSLLTGRVQWDAGKFVTPIGAEVIESHDNWNYTRSILFGYAIPFYHVGVRATVPVGDKLTLSGFLLNGWNNDYDFNANKTVAIGATVKPSDKVTWIANYMVGKETPDSNENRNLFDSTLTLTATEKVSFMANFDYGKEGDVKWWGLAAYAKLQATPSWALVARYEYVDDSEGGFMTIGQTAQSFTVTSDHTLAGGLSARLEYHLDHTPDPYFEKSDGSLTNSQSTLTVGLVYGFGGKI